MKQMQQLQESRILLIIDKCFHEKRFGKKNPTNLDVVMFKKGN